MNKLKIILLAICLSFVSNYAYSDVSVKSHYRSGKYTKGHYRSSPNATVRDNYTYKGNRNPHTGKRGTNKYKYSPSSGYYKYKGKSRRSYRRK